MNIEQIMKPYFDKKEEFEKKNKINDLQFDKKEELENEINNSYSNQIKLLNLRLDNLRNNKNQEISEYLAQKYLNKTNFLGYEAVKKDLEQEYLKIEQKIENQIQNLIKERENQIQKLKIEREQTYLEKEREIQKQKDNFDKFYRVDIREMVEVKEEVRKNLIAERKRLNNALQEMKLSFDSTMNRLSNFKYIYDENHVVQNGSEYKKLFDESHSLIDEKNNIEKQLKQIEEYLSLTELTSKEIEILMRSMNPVERQEYDRRKGLNKTEVTQNNTDFTEEKPPIAPEKNEEVKKEEKIKQNVTQLLDAVYSDIVSYARKLRQFGVDQLSEEDKQVIQLPTGMYLNESDLNNAVKKYYRKNKGRTYRVEGISKEFTITKDSINKLKESLKKCSAVKLVRDKKLGSYDLTRVFGRERVDEIQNIAKKPEEIMTDRKVEAGMPTGWYINGEQFIQKLPYLFEENKQKWLEKVFKKRKSKKQNEDTNYDHDYGFAEEPEYTVLGDYKFYDIESELDSKEPEKTR